MDEISIFLSYVFWPKPAIYTKAEIEATVEMACKTAETSISTLGYTVAIHCEAYLENYEAILNQQIRDQIERSDVAIVDVSETNPNVIYELGLAHGLHRHTILIQHEDSSHALFSDMRGFLLLRYRRIADIRGQLALAIERALLDILLKQDRFSPSMRRLWNFGEETSPIINVVGPDTRRLDGLPHAVAPNKDYPDYAHLEFIGDKDAILEAQMQLARLYPSSLIHPYPASWFSPQLSGDPLVVIGGPLGENGGGNSLTHDISNHWQLPISYTQDCKTLLFEKQEYGIESDDQGNLTTDYGVIARLPNPWNQKGRVLLFHGIHTYGVLGAVRAIANTTEGRANTDLISRVCGPDPLFSAWCKVTIVRRALTTPRLQLANISPFSQEKADTL